MISVIASADTHFWLSILVKALTYVTTLVAAGSVLVSVALRELSEEGRISLSRSAVIAAFAAAILSVLRVPVRASFLMGGTFEGALDSVMLGVVAESPLGVSVIVRLVGLGLIVAILSPMRGAKWIAFVGAVLTCVSFALRGHALGDPRFILGALISLHMLGLSFWIGALAPLMRAIRTQRPAKAGALAHEFGRKAVGVVAVLVAAGGATLVLFGVATPEALNTAYGQMFFIKLILFAGVLGLAALNMLRLTPALHAEIPGAAQRLRRSIFVESALILAILVTTAILTTVGVPSLEHATRMAPPQMPQIMATSLM